MFRNPAISIACNKTVENIHITTIIAIIILLLLLFIILFLLLLFLLLAVLQLLLLLLLPHAKDPKLIMKLAVQNLY